MWSARLDLLTGLAAVAADVGVCLQDERWYIVPLKHTAQPYKQQQQHFYKTQENSQSTYHSSANALPLTCSAITCPADGFL
jgi:hypothetical protein